MTKLARKYLNKFGECSVDIETIAIEKDQDYEKEKTYWIFSDGSAIYQDSYKNIGVVTNYGINSAHEQLRD